MFKFRRKSNNDSLDTVTIDKNGKVVLNYQSETTKAKIKKQVEKLRYL
jgi:hypothetical protein